MVKLESGLKATFNQMREICFSDLENFSVPLNLLRQRNKAMNHRGRFITSLLQTKNKTLYEIHCFIKSILCFIARPQAGPLADLDSCQGPVDSAD